MTTEKGGTTAEGGAALLAPSLWNPTPLPMTRLPRTVEALESQ